MVPEPSRRTASKLRNQNNASANRASIGSQGICFDVLYSKNQAQRTPYEMLIYAQRMISRHSPGFTLIELIMVIVIVGILAVAVIPRFADQSAFESRGFHDETLALLRYAQKTAIAQRRTVCVTFSSTNASLRIASAAATSICDKDLTGPNGDAHGTITARSGISYDSAVSFDFNGLGQASISQTINVHDATSSIVVEADTGYVHE